MNVGDTHVYQDRAQNFDNLLSYQQAVYNKKLTWGNFQLFNISLVKFDGWV